VQANQTDTFRGLAGKRVLVVGSGRGMGKVIAQGFLKNKSRVMIADTDQSRLDQFSAEAPAIIAQKCDITDLAQVDALLATARDKLGGLDILMNNTGIGGPWGPIEEADVQDWHRMMAINVTGTFYLLRGAVPMLKEAGGGCIVLTSSTSGYMASPLSAPYAASKFAVEGLAKSLAVELGGYGIRVNTVCPGPCYSTRQEETRQAEARNEGITVEQARERYFMKYALSLSLPTVIDPEDIANMVLFACSDSANKVTGQTLSVDGYTQTLIEPPPASLLLTADPKAAIPQTEGNYMKEAKSRFHARFNTPH